MANYATLKAAIAAAIRENGNNEITGNLLQQQLLAIVNSLGAGYQFMGIATPETNPGTTDQNVFYLASENGIYPNFGSTEIGPDEIGVFSYNGAWVNSKLSIPGIDIAGQGGYRLNKDLSLTTAYKTFDVNLLSGQKYTLTLVSASNADYLFYQFVRANGTFSEQNRIDGVGTSVEIVPPEDYVGIYFGYSGTVTLNVESSETINERLQGLQTEIDEQIDDLQTKVNRLNEETNTFENQYEITNTSALQLFEVNLKTGYSYDIRIDESSDRYIDFYYVPVGGGAAVKIATWDFPTVTTETFVPPVDVQYIYGSISPGTKFTIIPNLNLRGIALDNQENVKNIQRELNEKVNVNYDNILNPEEIIDGRGFSSGGGIIVNPSFDGRFGIIFLPWLDAQKITANSVYGSGGFYCCQFDENKNFVPDTGVSGVIGIVTFTKADGAFYLGLTLDVSNGTAGVIHANYGETLSDDLTAPNPIKGYLKDIEAEIGTGNTLKLYAYADGNPSSDTETQFFGWGADGRCAIQRAIDAADGKTKTEIYCFGVFKATQTSQFVLQENGYYNIVFIPHAKSNIELIGQGEERTIVWADMPDDFAGYATYQPMEIWGNNCAVRSMSIFSKNARYCVHMDASGGRQADNYKISFFDVCLRHYPNAAQSFESPFGLGISDGMELRTERCKFYVSRNYTPPLYLHDNVNFQKEFNWYIKDCQLINPEIAQKQNTNQIMTIQTLGSNIRGNIIFEDNDLGMSFPVFYCENNNAASKTNVEKYDANIFVRIVGHVDGPIGYGVGNSTSAVLRIQSKTTGVNSTVRFVTTSSAFNTIVRGLLPSGYTEPNGVIHENGYQYRDGVVGLSGFAMGELAIDTGRICSLQNRLGDCTTNNKVLGVIIDGTQYNITFNQNYTNYSDADMLAVFTDVIGSVADVKLYNWGADYFPEIAPSFCRRRNTSTNVIFTGMGVHLLGNLMLVANNDSEVDAIALEDILPGYMGRISKCCVLSMYEADHHHVAMETYPVTDIDKYTEAFQGDFGIGETPGIFKKKDGGILHADWYGYLVFNKI